MDLLLSWLGTVAHRPNGQIVVAGTNPLDAKVERYAVIGGIGTYGNARGTVTATSINQQKTVVVNLSA